jgi:glycosyltransferase involved in cell wall biosynthesis
MAEEHRRLGLPFHPFHARETARRLREYDLAEAVLCPSRFVRDSFIEQGFPAERIFVVPYGLPEPAPDDAVAGEDDGIFRVLYVGQLGLRKGLRYLVEAFRRLRHPRKELLLVGPTAPPTGLEGVALPAGVRFAGVLKGDALADAYRRASVFALPTIEEGMALVVGEAMAHGKPVVTTVNSGADELIEEGREGFLVPIRDPAALADRLQRLADDPALCRQMGAAATRRAGEWSGWNRSEGRFLEALDAMVKLRPR